MILFVDGIERETLARAYAAHGVDAPKHLEGEFSFAIDEGDRLFAARDPFGTRPLFYATVGDRVRAATSIAELLPHVSRELDDFAIASFLVGGLDEFPVTTTYAQIRRLPPAHLLIAHGTNVEVRRYWQLPIEEEVRGDIVEGFLHHLDRAVELRVRGKRVSALMSGGLDSTSVAVTARRFAEPLHAYTMSFRTLLQDEEADYASRVARHAKLEHHVISRDEWDLFDGVEIRAEPHDDPLAGAFLHAARGASQDADVMLTGQGGDPLFYTSHGYLRGLLARMQLVAFAREVVSYTRRTRQLPPFNIRSAIKRRFGLATWRAKFPQWLNPDLVRRFDLRERFEAELPAAELHPRRPDAHRILLSPNWSLLFELWHRGQTGLDLDFAHPLFDRQLVEYAFRVPPMPWFANKHLLREAMRGRLPEDVRLRPKTPLPADPLRLRMQTSMVRLLHDLQSARLLERWVDRAALARALERPDHDGYTDYLLVLPFCLLRWLYHEAPYET